MTESAQADWLRREYGIETLADLATHARVTGIDPAQLVAHARLGAGDDLFRR
jgi:hypothetical protein